MTSILLDGLLMLKEYKEIIFIFFICSFGVGFLAVDFMGGNKGGLLMKMFTSVPIGVSVLCGLTYLAVLIGYLIPPTMILTGVLIFVCSVSVVVVEIYRGKLNFSGSFILYAGIVLFVLLLLRMPFLTRIIYPPYSDSSVHYQIVYRFLNPNLAGRVHWSLGTMFQNYYHYGFHGLVVWLALITGLEIENVIPLVGQLFLVVLPVSIYSLTYAITKNHPSSFFSGFLSAFGWVMPAFSTNWGKYPALGSLAVAPAFIAVLLTHEDSSARKFSKIMVWLFLLISMSMLHSRILVGLSFAVLAYHASVRIVSDEKLPVLRSIGYTLLYLVSLLPLYGILAEFYNRFLVIIILLFLFPFAFRAYPRSSVCVFFFTFAVWLSTLIPFDGNGQTLLDRQYVGMMLYIPFSVMGGLGLAGLLSSFSMKPRLSILATLLFMSIPLINFPYSGLYPDLCCNYFTHDDYQAIQWIQNNTIKPSLFLISSFASSNRKFESDAGIWIYPLTGQPVNRLAYNFDWASSIEINSLCEISSKDIYVYWGGRDFSFNVDELDRQTGLSIVFSSGATRIYHLTGCPE